ncbi:MAG TPA: tRNA (N6-threonylcarbamoyladenosine(37)-N6)-methyltransferase TrmO [Candidatus Sulfotelmatobacter sp.]|jgi:tRNA-Thr(GGU) m(6)t(6)A37 methyltransferase TsaA|nr:tRNA (N6-threonylcarbamoyladenosine(37)-N6)-methyltransferase TrmO [Candidatus Sulfotelmatobacter sp.]
MDLQLHPIGVVRSELKQRENAPHQGFLGAPEAWLELDDSVLSGLDGLAAGMELILLTWLHLSRRDQLRATPRRSDGSRKETGVFSTRSPERPNPIGLHRVELLKISGNRLKVAPLEALDGTPLLDIKPLLKQVDG